MKLKCITIAAIIIIHLTLIDANLKANLKKRNTVIKIYADTEPQQCNHGNLLKNNRTLKRIVNSSFYIVTGKISGVQKRRKRDGEVFKVFLRRVLKGDVVDFSDVLNFETRTLNSSSRAYVFAQSDGRGGWKKCARALKVGDSALFFVGELESPLKLVADPVPSTLENLKRIKSYLKGK